MLHRGAAAGGAVLGVGSQACEHLLRARRRRTCRWSRSRWRRRPRPRVSAEGTSAGWSRDGRGAPGRRWTSSTLRPSARSSARRRARTAVDGRQVDLEIGVGEHDRPDVAALDHPPAPGPAPRPRWRPTSSARTPGWRPRPKRPRRRRPTRMPAVASSPSTTTRSPTSMRVARARRGHGLGVGGVDAVLRSADQATARYMAPVSRRSTPRCSATAWASVDLPGTGRAVDGHHLHVRCAAHRRPGPVRRAEVGRRSPGSWWPRPPSP